MTWRDRAPRPLIETSTGPRGEPCSTSLDRRWLHRLEGDIAVLATTDRLRQLGDDLREYLGETCQHHWLDGTDEFHGAYRQCLWCHRLQDDSDQN